MIDAPTLRNYIRDQIQAQTGGTIPAAGLSGMLGLAAAIIYAIDQNAGSGGGGGVPTARQIATTGGLQGGGDLSADRTLSLTDTGVSAGSYTLASLTVDAKGRVTAISSGSVSPPTITLSGDVTGSGTTAIVATIAAGAISTAKIADDAVTYAKLQNVSTTQRLIGRNTAGAGDPEEVTAGQVLDWIGATRGQVLYRGASGWAALSPGTSGQVLKTNGAGADPSWASVAGAGTPSINIVDATAPASVNLTTEGTLDWYAPGNANPTQPQSAGVGTLNAKASGGRRIVRDWSWIYGGNAQTLNTAATSSPVSTFTSTAGDSIASAAYSSTNRSILSNTTGTSVGWGFGFTVPAATTSRTLRIYTTIGVGSATAVTVTATLSDGTTQSLVIDATAFAGFGGRMITITYTGASEGSTLNVTVLVTGTVTAGTNRSLACSAVTLA